MPERLLGRLRPFRLGIPATFDGLVWLVAMVAFTGSRFELGRLGEPPYAHALILGSAAAVHTTLGWVLRLHQGRAALGTLGDAPPRGGGRVLRRNHLRRQPHAGALSDLVYPGGRHGGGAGRGGVGAWGRALYRRLREPAVGAVIREGKTPVVIAGAGDAARQLIASMLGEQPISSLEVQPSLRSARHEKMHD